MRILLQTESGRRDIPAAPGDTLLAALRRAGFSVTAPCGGSGRCGKCVVYRRAAAGWEPVSACRTQAEDGMEVRLPDRQTLSVEGADCGFLLPDGPGLSGYGVACDIGTTTVACQLIDLSNGKILAWMGEENAQAPYGGDVISRIHAAMEGGLGALSTAIRSQLRRMVEELCSRAGIAASQISRMTAAANPAMCHLLTGLPPDSLGRAPFTPVSRFGACMAAEEWGLPFEGEVYIAPAVSGFVGGDITAGMLAAELDRREGLTILMDVGTNGEMVLGSGSRFICCSTAAGPVFEGAHLRCGMTAAAGAISAAEWRDDGLRLEVIGGKKPSGICGSGFLDAAAMLLDLGVVDETGRMLPPSESGCLPAAVSARIFELDGAPAFQLVEEICVTQADIRKLQLGKGAIAAGLQILMDACGARSEDIQELLLAGGFGSRLRPESAARLGLIPRELLPVARAAGNTALLGAGKALVSLQTRDRLAGFQAHTEYLELSSLPAFNSAYMDAMFFPEADAL